VVFNGADYDPWMPKLLAVAPRTGRTVLAVADLIGRKPGDNPHVWYDPDTAPAVAKALSRALIAADPAHEAEYAERLQRFLGSLSPVREKMAAIAAKYGGAEITATEPVFGYMAAALKLRMRNERFQLAVMNDSEPSARDVAAFERDLTLRKVRLMLYNKQATSKIVRHLVDVARDSKIPVVGVSETQPSGLSFQDWMLGELDEVERALAGLSS
jgi:zinc/manganese transport system substrate-binding protein